MQNWTKIVNQALKNIKIKTVNPEDDISPGAMFHNYLMEFLEKRAMAQNKQQLLVDRVFKDEKLEAYIFIGQNLVTFLENQKRFTIFKSREIQDRLRQLKGYPKRYYVDKEHHGIRVWILPFTGLEKFVDEKLDNFEVGFTEEFKDEPF